MKKTTRIIIAVISFLIMAGAYEYVVHIWAQGQHGAVMRLDIFISYPIILFLTWFIYYLSGKNFFKKLVISLAVIIGIIAGLGYYYADDMSEWIFKQANKDIVVKSEKIIPKLTDLPENLKDKIVVYGNPEAKKVIVNTQGGPETNLDFYSDLEMYRDLAKLDTDEVFIVDVHQCQTLKTDFYNTNRISFEDAKKCDDETIKTLAEVIKYFKSKDRQVYLVGVSFGAFVVEDMLTEYGNLADKNFIVVGRLDMPEKVWKEFSKGGSVGFSYDKEGNKTIVDFTSEEAGMGGENEIGDENTSKIAAGIGYKRFTKLLKDIDLSNTTYVYGERDEEVGSLTKEEVDFLKSKNVNIIVGKEEHSESIDMFASKYLLGLIYQDEK